jgi:hypothetical protein
MTDILELGRGGMALRISVERQQNPDWYTTVVASAANPWHGSFDTIFTTDDLRDWVARLRDTALPRRVVLGGDRAAEVVLDVDEQQGGTPGSLAIQVEVVMSGDDPFPFLRYLIFDVPPDFGTRVADAVEAALRA